MPIEIKKADPDTPEIAALIATHIAYGEAAYPSESNHHLTPDAHVEKDLHLVAAWDGPTCLGMIGLQMMAQHSAEVKSMHVLAQGPGPELRYWRIWSILRAGKTSKPCIWKLEAEMHPARHAIFMRGQALALARLLAIMCSTPKVCSCPSTSEPCALGIS